MKLDPAGTGFAGSCPGLGHTCSVVAPSLIQSKQESKSKPMGAMLLCWLGCIALASWPRFGLPTLPMKRCAMSYVPGATAAKVLSKARQDLSGFLLRHRKIYSGIRTWTQAYRRWLTTVRFDHPGQQVVLQDYIDAVITAEQRVARLTRQITELMPAWSMAPVATAIQAMGGRGRRSCAVWECGGFPSSDCPCGRAWLLAVAFA